MAKVDRWAGVLLAVLAVAVLWSARGFPNVPGQKLGAGFLPTLVGAGLLLCGIALLVRSRRAGHEAATDESGRPREQLGAPLAVIAAALIYIVLAGRLGFLLTAPLALMVVFRALHVRWLPSIAWAIGGTLVVHFAFYKLLRVPLPWGVLRPFY